MAEQHTDQSAQSGAAPGVLFGVPKYGSQARMVLDNKNQALGAEPNSGSQIVVETSQLDQLDIVKGNKLYVQQTGTWTAGQGNTLHSSPFGVAASYLGIQWKLQAAYNSFNQTGPLAALIQGYRPQWGSRTPSQSLAARDPFAGMVVPTSAQEQDYHIDVPLGIKLDEYFELSATGEPIRKMSDQIVTPYYMAAQARVVTPTITLSPQLSVGDTLRAPRSKSVDDSTSTYTSGTWSGQLYRDAWWNTNNPAANPPQHPWMYTRDYYTQPTAGQPTAGVLIQNTNTSVGQVLSLYGFVWDPEANSGYGDIVPFSAVDQFELVSGGSLVNLQLSPQALEDRMFSAYPGLEGVGAWDKGAFLLDYALDPDGAFLSNARAINTYVVNGVQLNIKFKARQAPGPKSTVYMGVEALKLATS